MYTVVISHPYLVTRISSPASRHPHLVTIISSPLADLVKNTDVF